MMASNLKYHDYTTHFFHNIYYTIKTMTPEQINNLTKDLELLLEVLCTSAEKTQQNAQQTLYQLSTLKDAKLAYDVLITCGLDVKYIPDEAGSSAKLYLQNESLAANEAKVRNTLASASLFKQIKNVLDEYNDAGDYSLSLANVNGGRQLTLVVPTDEQLHGIIHKKAQPEPSSAKNIAPAPQGAPRPKARPKPIEDDILAAGPAVARTAIPEGFKSSATEEDGLRKRMLFYITSHAFTTGAWLLFGGLILGIIFSILVTIKGFLCPDVVMTDKSKIPSYCGMVHNELDVPK